jgi:hypothetical protein
MMSVIAAQFTPAFRALNPDCMVPVLELDSGFAVAQINLHGRHSKTLLSKKIRTRRGLGAVAQS